MKKMILTSCGIRDKNLIKEFKNSFDKPIEKLKVLYIPVAADAEKGDKTWLKKEYNSILELGIQEKNITEYRMDYEINVMKFDMIYVIGGNSFYLLKKIRETNFDIKIKEAIENGIMYVGSSAGSIIMGSTTKTALPFDDNNGYLTNFEGLKLFNGIIIPHYGEVRKEYIDEQRKIYSDTIYPIEDNHGIIVLNNEIKEI